jgi:hypothetical protein
MEDYINIESISRKIFYKPSIKVIIYKGGFLPLKRFEKTFVITRKRTDPIKPGDSQYK